MMLKDLLILTSFFIIKVLILSSVLTELFVKWATFAGKFNLFASLAARHATLYFIYDVHSTNRIFVFFERYSWHDGKMLSITFHGFFSFSCVDSSFGVSCEKT